MPHTLADSLRVVLPHFPAALASANDLALLERLAQALPPVPRAGFECRLNKSGGGIDLQQCITTEVGEAEALLQYVTEMVRLHSEDLAPAWRRLYDFCTEWANPASWLRSKHSGITEIWLELDSQDGNISLNPPSLFFGLNHDEWSASEALKTTEAALAILHPERTDGARDTLRRFFKPCKGGLGIISHIGVMLSRETNSIRVNVKRLSRETMPIFLKSCGWSGLLWELEFLLPLLFDRVDRLVLCIDAGATAGETLGLECLFNSPPGQESRWTDFLDYLVSLDLCHADEREALLSWPGTIDPAHSVEAWPDHLILKSLQQPHDRFSVLQRRLSHVKLVYDPDVSAYEFTAAKAYFGFVHQWVQPELVQEKIAEEHEDNEAERERAREPAEYVETVRNYYDNVTPAILQHVGTTYQAGLIAAPEEADPYRTNNLWLASRAGLRPGQRVLDAGCGVCGPSIDLAQNFPGIEIVALTLSPVQARIARNLIGQNGLLDRIRVVTGDFHRLPFEGNCFDVVLFFETAGYAYDHRVLFTEVYRVLRPGGVGPVHKTRSPVSSREAGGCGH